jgi:hypothetical protein
MRVNDDDQAIGADILTSHHRAARTYRKGRVCREPGCRTVLSIYNSEDRCAAHHLAVVETPRRRSLPRAS